MQWIKDELSTVKPIIAMCHMPALPGDPKYDRSKGVRGIVDFVSREVESLQSGGVDAIMFSNESSLPYLTTVPTITTATMARVIGEIRHMVEIPFGVNVLWDPNASIDLAVATGAGFVREIFTGVYGSDFGVWNTNCGAVVRHQHAVSGENVRLFFNIVPEAAAYLGNRSLRDIAKSTVFNAEPDALCVSGLTAGEETSAEDLKIVKDVVPNTAVFANTGVRVSNVADQLAVADGAIVGTAFKRDGYIWNEVDPERVRVFMDAARNARGS
jgi:membrane complex biogenesis BtpA family protein